MMKTTRIKPQLKLNSETLRELTEQRLSQVEGGYITQVGCGTNTCATCLFRCTQLA